MRDLQVRLTEGIDACALAAHRLARFVEAQESEDRNTTHVAARIQDLVGGSVSSLEAVWEHREEVVYPRLFGPLSRGIFLLTANLFADAFRQSDVDPRWLHYGVLEYGPTPTRRTWVYVTSGASNPWELEPADYDVDAYSGMGTELVLEVPAQADWAVGCMQKLLAFNILLAHGRLGAEPLAYGHRIPLHNAINGDPACQLRFVVMVEPRSFAPSFQLDSGRVDLLQAVGITEAERDLAKAKGTEALLALITERGTGLLTDPARQSAA